MLRIQRYVRNDPRPQEVRLPPEKADRKQVFMMERDQGRCDEGTYRHWGRGQVGVQGKIDWLCLQTWGQQRQAATVAGGEAEMGVSGGRGTGRQSPTPFHPCLVPSGTVSASESQRECVLKGWRGER